MIKFHESPYACFANNPIWFIDPSGKDTMLVSSKTGKPLNDLMKKGGEDLIFYSGEDETWDGAQQLFYEIGEITGESGGTPSKRGDPVKWRWTNMYGEIQYLQDQTERFNSVMRKWEAYAESEGRRISTIPGRGQSGVRLAKFRETVTDGAPADIKDINNPDSFAPRFVGEWSWQNGMLTRYDDYGNINYGRAGTAYQIPGWQLVLGANVNQFCKNVISLFGFGETVGIADEDRDTKMIKYGIDLYKK